MAMKSKLKSKKNKLTSRPSAKKAAKKVKKVSKKTKKAKKISVPKVRARKKDRGTVATKDFKAPGKKVILNVYPAAVTFVPNILPRPRPMK